MFSQHNSFSSSCSDDEWDSCAGQKRLTAKEELRGHLEDCLSLYASRFVFTEVSLRCIQAIATEVGSSATIITAAAATPEAAAAEVAQEEKEESKEWRDTARDADTPIHSRSASASETVRRDAEDAGADGPDMSSVATTLFIRDGVKGGAPGAVLGVIVAFHYLVGFAVCAEKVYVSVAAAQQEAEQQLQSASHTVPLDQLLRGERGWCSVGRVGHARAEGGDDGASGCVLANQVEGGGETEAYACCQGDVEGCEGGEHTDCYESLMALLVDRYL